MTTTPYGHWYFSHPYGWHIAVSHMQSSVEFTRMTTADISAVSVPCSPRQAWVAWHALQLNGCGLVLCGVEPQMLRTPAYAEGTGSSGGSGDGRGGGAAAAPLWQLLSLLRFSPTQQVVCHSLPHDLHH